MVKVAIISLYSSETPVLKIDFGFDTKLTFLICKLVFMRVACLIWQFPFKPFHANIPFLYPLKTTGNKSFSDVFSEYRNKTLA